MTFHIYYFIGSHLRSTTLHQAFPTQNIHEAILYIKSSTMRAALENLLKKKTFYTNLLVSLITNTTSMIKLFVFTFFFDNSLNFMF